MSCANSPRTDKKIRRDVRRRMGSTDPTRPFLSGQSAKDIATSRRCDGPKPPGTDPEPEAVWTSVAGSLRGSGRTLGPGPGTLRSLPWERRAFDGDRCGPCTRHNGNPQPRMFPKSEMRFAQIRQIGVGTAGERASNRSTGRGWTRIPFRNNQITRSDAPRGNAVGAALRPLCKRPRTTPRPPAAHPTAAQQKARFGRALGSAETGNVPRRSAVQAGDSRRCGPPYCANASWLSGAWR